MAEIWVSGAFAVGGALGGAYLSSEGNKKAAGKAAAGADAAIAEQRRQFDTIQNNIAPWQDTGRQALNELNSVLGYSSTPTGYGNAFAGATPYTPQPIADDGFFNTGAGRVVNPWTVTGKLGGAGKILDPAGGLLGNLFGNTHGDEKRNLKAFAAESGVMQLPDGRLMLPDGSIFNESQLKDVAGTWYGAKHAPDGNQAEWQQRYDTLLGGLQKAPTSTAQPAPATGATGPNYDAFFQSPDYTFRRNEGTRGIERTAAARGGAFSGNALRALTEFNSNLAGNEFGNYFNRRAALAGIGQTATTEANNAGLITSGRVGNALQEQGDARASGVVGQYNAYGNALSDLAQFGGYYMGNRKTPSGYDSSGRRV